MERPATVAVGFSFVTLRLSTLALGVVATVAEYLILRELRAPKHIALLGAFVVAAKPTSSSRLHRS